MAKHNFDEQRREKIREKAASLKGEMIFPLQNHDIFQFKCLDSRDAFVVWVAKNKTIDHTEIGKQLRVAVKYKKVD
ncbi:MAG: hypothetical protein M0R80_02810 [Proteobacteria bacterium]|jgi:hypothetical protein|nr:hypothetical protein [Pseudomonadota bacterium]